MSFVNRTNYELVFVYGTLKKGRQNHNYMKKAAFIGKAITQQKYAMYCDSFGIPYVTDQKSICQIHGEVYKVDAKTLAALDRLEEHPDWYIRKKITAVLESGQEIEAWLYFHDSPKGRLVPTGTY